MLGRLTLHTRLLWAGFQLVQTSDLQAWRPEA